MCDRTRLLLFFSPSSTAPQPDASRRRPIFPQHVSNNAHTQLSTHCLLTRQRGRGPFRLLRPTGNCASTGTARAPAKSGGEGDQVRHHLHLQRFERTDHSGDEVVLVRFLQLLLDCLRGPAGTLLSDQNSASGARGIQTFPWDTFGFPVNGHTSCANLSRCVK
jgi:hypothetical protein